ncbi:MAG: 2OG-Fe(II) oxygenase [Planctomycetes bacterium]|nr:2OG-Fe(II) oxygenase [Planctomycetota bacterium]
MSGPVLLLPGVLAPADCERAIERAHALGLGTQRTHAASERRRAHVDDSDLAAKLWTTLAAHLPVLAAFYPRPLRPEPEAGELSAWRPAGLSAFLRFYAYSPGERFPPHTDLAHEVSHDERTFLTVVLYLDEGCEGGETRFLDVDPPEVIRPRAGTALVFAHERRHEGVEVTSGVKHVLRTDVVFRRTSP